jgi:hypothetical protein
LPTFENREILHLKKFKYFPSLEETVYLAMLGSCSHRATVAIVK